MNNFTQFMSKDNINLLWDVLLDELHVNPTNKSLISNVKIVFESNIKPFTARINPNANIMDLNKQFLSQVVLAVNKLFPKDQNIKRITIMDEEVFEPYKIEDIHASRQSDFEREVEKKKIELENYMTPQKPMNVDFSDKYSDGKIVAMDSLIAEKMTQRNMEMEELHNSNYNKTDINPQEWLSSKETRESQPNNNIYEKNNNIDKQNVKLKYITPDGNILNQKIDKKVSWSDDSINIFKKLKRVEPQDDNKKQQYVEQVSTALPDVKQEEIVRGISQDVLSQNEPIIPKSEIVRQMNEMSAKIDTLFEMVEKLTKLVPSSEIITNNF